MRYLVLACDYDGTLARGGMVSDEAREALDRLAASGRKLMLVTGRELPDLLEVFPDLDRFDRIVAENGLLLYNPATRESRVLADPPPARLVAALEARGVAPLSVGSAIIATWEPHETTVLEVIRDLGLEYQVIFNKGAVMILPSGVNKGTGLNAALAEMHLSPHNVVGVGDAENDHAFLSQVECAVAVANALPTLKERADWVTTGTHEAGVMEIIDGLLRDDLASLELGRHRLVLGKTRDGSEVGVPPFGSSILLAGPSGSGKSTFAIGLIERLWNSGYQYCLIDPEGDYQGIDGAVTVGDTRRPPTIDEVLQLLRDPRQNAVVNLVGLPLNDRPAFFTGLLPRVQELRGQFGRPHWLVVDEAHHLLPAAREAAARPLAHDLGTAILITVHPDWVAAPVLARIDSVVSVGSAPEETLKAFASAAGFELPELTVQPENGEVTVWRPNSSLPPQPLSVIPARLEHQRHQRKYAAGDLGVEYSFYFRGPTGKLNLRAQNLTLFNQLAEGIDDETWLFHLREEHYSRWFRDVIKDDELATAARAVERERSLSAIESRNRIRSLIEERYTAPA
jgi:hydroxymethylpyrimidine pyrophosphatase-like HAD family hydrolase